MLTRLLFDPADPSISIANNANGNANDSKSDTKSASPALTRAAFVSERYATLPCEDRIAILSFMCNLAVSSKAIHAHMEVCEEQLTALRKEKIEVNRLKKQ